MHIWSKTSERHKVDPRVMKEGMDENHPWVTDDGFFYSYRWRKKQSPCGNPCEEVKEALSEKEYVQAMAQTIVFSLLQKKERPTLKHCIIPNTVISPKEIEVILFDADNDILLSGNKFPLFPEKNSEKTAVL